MSKAGDSRVKTPTPMNLINPLVENNTLSSPDPTVSLSNMSAFGKKVIRTKIKAIDIPVVTTQNLDISSMKARGTVNTNAMLRYISHPEWLIFKKKEIPKLAPNSWKISTVVNSMVHTWHINGCETN